MDKHSRPEKRQYARTEISIKARIELLEPDAARIIKSRKAADSDIRGNRPSPFPVSDFSTSADDKMDHILHSIYLLNEKLDRVIDMLEEKNGKKFLRVKETKNISGNGMSLILLDPVAEGQILNISLSIPGFPLGVFNSYGEVIWTKKSDKNGNRFFEIGVQFININENQRESLIAYAFSEQRKSIRKCKEEKNNHP